jgi:hypothetical protein
VARFPIQLGALSVATPAQLGAVARDDARAGGTVIPGKRVFEWAHSLVASGDLDRAGCAGLCAALLRHGDAATIAEGARLAALLGARELGPLILHALEGHDTGLLLEPDPIEPTRSVEDALLRSAASLVDLADPVVREAVLVRLRNSALRAEEARVLATWATPAEIAAWMPALLVEGFPAEARDALDARLAAGGDGAAALGAALGASRANPR